MSLSGVLVQAITLVFVTSSVFSVQAQPGNLLRNIQLKSKSYRGWVFDRALKDVGLVRVDFSVGVPSIRLEPNSRNTKKEKPLGLGQMLHVQNLADRTLTIRGAMKSDGAAGLILAFALDRAGKSIANVVLQELDRSDEFRLQTADLMVPPEAANVIFTIVTPSTSGAVWFRDLYVGLKAATETHGGSAVISIDASQILRTIPRTMFGTNIEWVRNANTLWDDRARATRPKLTKLAQDLGVSVVRYPGGGFADYYHWRAGIGPPGGRTALPHVLDTGSSVPLFGTNELVAFTKSIGAEPLLQVNVVTGTAREAAEWVAYCNQPANLERALNGSVEPFDIHHWEIGNEQYIKPDGSLPLPNDSYLSPENYAETFQEFARAMKTADPTIKLGAVGGRNTGYYRFMHDEKWNETVLTMAASQIDFLSIHNAYSPLLLTDAKKTSFADVYRAMFAFPLEVQQNLHDVSRDIDRFAGPHARRIKIAVTEWGPLFGFDNSNPYVDHAKTLGSALFAASLFQTFLKVDKVDVLTSFKFTDESFMGWVSGKTAEPKPIFYALQMYSRHFGELLVKAAVNGPTFNSKQAGLVSPHTAIPYLDAVASLNGDGSKLYLIVVNKHFTDGINTLLHLNAFEPGNEARTWTLTGPSLDANNGPDMEGQGVQAEDPDHPMFSKGRPGFIRPVMGKVSTASRTFAYTFAPRSVTAIELDRVQ